MNEQYEDGVRKVLIKSEGCNEVETCFLKRDESGDGFYLFDDPEHPGCVQYPSDFKYISRKLEESLRYFLATGEISSSVFYIPEDSEPFVPEGYNYKNEVWYEVFFPSSQGAPFKDSYFVSFIDSTHIKMVSNIFNKTVDEVVSSSHPLIYHIGEFLSRNPLFYEYLLKHYRKEASIHKKFICTAEELRMYVD